MKVTIFPLLLAKSKYFLFDLFYIFDLDFLKHQFSTWYLQTASNCSVQDALMVTDLVLSSIHSVSEKLRGLTKKSKTKNQQI